ncbi:hypothetical protein [Gallibacterium anatis]|uniref:Uncharacterized protein n=1 Tax=Gallibacterium anatis 12656/12 TaxID=1195244 RepID=U1I5B6_9PAST|nr:hypothetical protein N561_05565 [Gallibacterium anatis 12656/12]
MYSAPELLKPHHHLDLFDCGEEVLNVWLKRNALKINKVKQVEPL